MPRRFAYYDRLSAKDKSTYRKSDEAPSVTVPDRAALAPLVADLEAALATGKRARVAIAANALARTLFEQLGVPNVNITVRLKRPELDDGAELHGLYTFATGAAPAKLEVWMRTAAKKNVVRFRTFLRTFIHGIVHHLDVTLLALEDSFHTEAFFRRESSLVRQLLNEHIQSTEKARGNDAPSGSTAGPPSPPRPFKQLSLF